MSTTVPSTLTTGSYIRAWLLVGLRSFGGGPATLFLIRQVFVDETGWITEDQFTRMWSLCQLTPGINLLGLTILIGRRLFGWRGVALSLLGLLLPSAGVTVLITAFYARVQHAPEMRAALRGILPATVGVGLAAAWDMAKPPVEASRREGLGSLALSIVLLVGAAAFSVVNRTAVFPTLIVAGAIAAAYRMLRRRASDEEEDA